MCFFCYLIWGSSTFFWVFNGKIRWVWFGWYELKFDLSVKLQGFPRQACIWSVPFLLLGHRAGFLTPTKIETAILHVESQSSSFVWFSEPSPSSQQETTPDSRNCLSWLSPLVSHGPHSDFDWDHGKLPGRLHCWDTYWRSKLHGVLTWSGVKFSVAHP